MSARHSSGHIADLVKEFCAVQGLPAISESWPGNLVSQYSPASEEPEGEPTAFSGIGPLLTKDEIRDLTGADDGYDSLRAIYAMALEQAQGGKGRERHANGQPFDQQPICQGGRRFGAGCLIYQAWKKAHETPVLMNMDNGTERAIRELLGVINYAAAAIIVLQEGK